MCRACAWSRVLTQAVADVCGCPQESVTLPSTKFTKRPAHADTWVNSGGARGGRNLKDVNGVLVARRRYGKIKPSGGDTDVETISAAALGSDLGTYELRYQQYNLVKLQDTTCQRSTDPDPVTSRGKCRNRDQEDWDNIVEDLSCRLYHVHPPRNHASFPRLGIPAYFELMPIEAAEIETAQMFRLKRRPKTNDPNSGPRKIAATFSAEYPYSAQMMMQSSALAAPQQSRSGVPRGTGAFAYNP